MMPLSKKLGICSWCKSRLLPKYLPRSQFNNYWDLYLRRKMVNNLFSVLFNLFSLSFIVMSFYNSMNLD